MAQPCSCNENRAGCRNEFHAGERPKSRFLGYETGSVGTIFVPRDGSDTITVPIAGAACLVSLPSPNATKSAGPHNVGTRMPDGAGAERYPCRASVETGSTIPSGDVGLLPWLAVVCRLAMMVLKDPRLVRQFWDGDSEIDSEVKPLVAALNAIPNTRTIGSCQGHVGRWYSPYVYFTAPTKVAARLAIVLRQWTTGPARLSAADWEITEDRGEDGQSRFRLGAPAYDRAARSIAGSTVQFLVRRKQVREDLFLIAQLVQGVATEELPS